MILENVTVEAVAVKPSKYNEGDFQQGYKIGDTWYNIDTTSEDRLASRGDIVKVEVEGKTLLRLKVTGKGEAPALTNKGKPAGKTYSKPFTPRVPYKKPAGEFVSMALSTALKCATDIHVARGETDTAAVKKTAIELASMIVASHGEEALELVKKADVVQTASTAVPAAKLAPAAAKKPAAKIEVREEEVVFDDDIPF